LQGNADSDVRRKRRKFNAEQSTKKHWIGCLFTSDGYGKPTKRKPGKDPPGKILQNTRAALKDLVQQLEVLDAPPRRLDSADVGTGDPRLDGDAPRGSGTDNGRRVGANTAGHGAGRDPQLGSLYACKFNSGSFGVEWKDTRAVIEEVLDGSNKTLHVISRPAEKK
jgi:ADP-ribose 1''-phosphate phosphatase